MRSGLLLIFRLFNRLQKFYPQMFESYSHRKNKNLLFSVCFDYGEQGPTLTPLHIWVDFYVEYVNRADSLFHMATPERSIST